MSTKQKYPRAEALKVARHVCLSLADHCVRLICGLFDTKRVNKVDAILDRFIAEGILAKRKNVNGSEMWGEKNKLAVHVATGIPVDFFATTEESWFNYLVCRTGGAENNRQIAVAANIKGWTWNPYGSGFSRQSGLGKELHPVKRERDVFDFVGLPYREPWQRI